MTALGKLFVMFNVAVSLLMAFAAFALYANSVDWAYDATKPGQPGGLLKVQEDQIKEYTPMQAPLENAWRTARSDLWAKEDARRIDRAWYVGNLEHLRTVAKDGDPAMLVVTEKSLPKRDPKTGRPEMKVARIRGDKDMGDALAPLSSRAFYQAEYKTHLATNLDLLDKVEKEAKKDIAETNKMLDAAGRKMSVDGKEPHGVRGLRTLLVDERIKREGVETELRIVEPLVINTGAGSSQLSLREAQLNERIEELTKYIQKRWKLDSESAKR